MIVAITGGRDHNLTVRECVWIVQTLERLRCTVFRHGCAPGVDTNAAEIAEAMDLTIEPYSPAVFGDWPACGPKRNRAMLLGTLSGNIRADALLRLPSKRGKRSGTHNCETQAIKLGIEVYYPDGSTSLEIPF